MDGAITTGHTLVDMMNEALPIWQQLLFLLRILAAVVCGAVIGIERSRRYKEAGVRTHIIVCAAAALFMIISKYAFVDLSVAGSAFSGTRGADGSRIASQVVSGISFLGAGIIFRNGSNIKGLTTAAGVWATAAVGMTLGSGLYVIGFAVTIILLIIQIVMHKFTIGGDSLVSTQFRLVVNDSEAFRADLYQAFDNWKVQVVETGLSRNDDGTTTFNLSIKMRSNLTYQDFVKFFDSHSDVVSFQLVRNS